MKKLLSVLLALIMVYSIFPPITVRAYINNVYQLKFNDLQYEHIELNTFSTIQPEPQEAFNVPLREQPRQTEPPTVIYSQARQSYNLLRTGNYNSTQVIDRFHQLFGHLSPDYILQNYTRIFDITSAEMDEVILEILTRGAVLKPLMTKSSKIVRR